MRPGWQGCASAALRFSASAAVLKFRADVLEDSAQALQQLGYNTETADDDCRAPQGSGLQGFAGFAADDKCDDNHECSENVQDECEHRSSAFVVVCDQARSGVNVAVDARGVRGAVRRVRSRFRQSGPIFLILPRWLPGRKSGRPSGSAVPSMQVSAVLFEWAHCTRAPSCRASSALVSAGGSASLLRRSGQPSQSNLRNSAGAGAAWPALRLGCLLAGSHAVMQIHALMRRISA